MSRVYGAKGRIGLIVPANNCVIEPELGSALPEGCTLHATRILAKGALTPDAVRRMEGDADAALQAIAATEVDVVAYCDMVTTFIMQAGWNESAVARFASVAGVPCVSAWTALRDALAKLGARRIAVGTPYPKQIHALAKPFFEKNGLEVRRDATLDIVAMREVPGVAPARLAAFVEELKPAGCDALVLLATDLPTFGSITALEQRHAMPVLTSNQTLLWAALARLAGATPRLPLGRLFQ